MSFNSEATLPVKIEFTGPKCPTNPEEEEEEEVDLKKGGPPIPPIILWTIIGVEVLVLLTVTVVILRHAKKEQNKELREEGADVNHNAVKEDAADYNCDDKRNHDGTDGTNDKYDMRNYKVVKFVLYDGTGEAKKEAVETALNVDGKDRNTM